ncbi:MULTISPECIES: pimeloyl-ACP methyl ester esterase BioH [unclassified Agarivorans]|uniref:pimeloyl-ACP methyl ester esterase BioH n=1 Tax=unclassified Agarivorans TaxID=2636026 RepID=UPI0026E43B4C|nr:MULTISPECIES: pimeloyl-ACP methyl ester esterase BioH [unclassified Agarivorans]MDO6687464.1 pimeloyl-ACP methyl ester esterase BioH [Agarivorans sp. 3_MG-2023]MDO6715230.1 pimeloyl-ACP methyl ester esterase BioH [Agarivorans sp. 2_MG-2023]
MSKLHFERQGSGPALILIHGWGLNGAVWQPVSELLSQHFTVYRFDLPGFGHSTAIETLSLEGMAQAIAKQVPEKALWLGWSLGGLVAKHAAIHLPEHVAGLITVASSAHFVAGEDWPGIQGKVLRGFALGLQQDFNKTLQQFLAIQAMGSAHAKQDIKQLRDLLADKPLPKLNALQQGLALLQSQDLRAQVAQINMPWLQLYGRSDALVPKAAMAQHAALHSEAQQYQFESSSHAPFISEKALFADKIIEFGRTVVV